MDHRPPSGLPGASLTGDVFPTLLGERAGRFRRAGAPVATDPGRIDAGRDRGRGPRRHPLNTPVAREQPIRLESPGRAEERIGGADQPRDFRISRARLAVSVGVLPTLTPAASRASFFAWAVPAEPETMAPAWPMVLPSGAVKPAT